MSLNRGVDISGALDTAETREAGGDPVIRKPKTTLHGKETERSMARPINVKGAINDRILV